MKVNLDTEDIEAITQAVTAEVVRVLKPLLKADGVSETLMTVEDLAVYLKVTEQWLYKRTAKKEIPFIKLGRFAMFKKSEIDKWVEREGKMPQLKNLSTSFEKRGSK